MHAQGTIIIIAAALAASAETKVKTKTKNSSQATSSVVSWFVAATAARTVLSCYFFFLFLRVGYTREEANGELYVNAEGPASELLYNNNNEKCTEIKQTNERTNNKKLELLKVQTHKWQWWRTRTTGWTYQKLKTEICIFFLLMKGMKNNGNGGGLAVCVCVLSVFSWKPSDLKSQELYSIFFLRFGI